MDMIICSAQRSSEPRRLDAVEEAAGLYQRKGNLAAIAPSADDSTPHAPHLQGSPFELARTLSLRATARLRHLVLGQPDPSAHQRPSCRLARDLERSTDRLQP